MSRSDMLSETPSQWEIWHARFDFSEGSGYEYRPILVLDVDDELMLAAMITGTANKLTLPHDCIIEEWSAAGLEKSSLVRLDRIIEIPSDYVGTQKRIGELAKNDIETIRNVLSEMMAES